MLPKINSPLGQEGTESETVEFGLRELGPAERSEGRQQVKCASDPVHLQLPAGLRKPFQEERGIRFNIPLDLQTPSNADNSDAAQANIPEMWSMDFWRTMLDEMARHRYNALTLWNLYPFPSIVQVAEFPEVALDDVLRAKPGSFDDRFSHSGQDMFRPGLLAGAEVVKRLSIRDKIAACDLALLDATGDEPLRRSAVQHLETALTHWHAYAQNYAARYPPSTRLDARLPARRQTQESRQSESGLSRGKATAQK